MTWRRTLRGLACFLLSFCVAACGSEPGTGPKMQIGNQGTQAKTTQRKSPSGEQPSQPVKAASQPSKPVAQQNPEPAKPKFDPSRVTKSNYDKIDLNMSVEEVCEILGPPSSEKALDPDSRELQWQTGVKTITATFRGGRLKIIDSRNLDSK